MKLAAIKTFMKKPAIALSVMVSPLGFVDGKTNYVMKAAMQNQQISESTGAIAEKARPFIPQQIQARFFATPDEEDVARANDLKFISPVEALTTIIKQVPDLLVMNEQDVQYVPHLQVPGHNLEKSTKELSIKFASFIFGNSEVPQEEAIAQEALVEPDENAEIPAQPVAQLAVVHAKSPVSLNARALRSSAPFADDDDFVDKKLEDAMETAKLISQTELDDPQPSAPQSGDDLDEKRYEDEMETAKVMSETAVSNEVQPSAPQASIWHATAPVEDRSLRPELRHAVATVMDDDTGNRVNESVTPVVARDMEREEDPVVIPDVRVLGNNSTPADDEDPA